jgi:hypothetical protein
MFGSIVRGLHTLKNAILQRMPLPPYVAIQNVALWATLSFVKERTFIRQVYRIVPPAVIPF